MRDRRRSAALLPHRWFPIALVILVTWAGLVYLVGDAKPGRSAENPPTAGRTNTCPDCQGAGRNTDGSDGGGSAPARQAPGRAPVADEEEEEEAPFGTTDPDAWVADAAAPTPNEAFAPQPFGEDGPALRPPPGATFEEQVAAGADPEELERAEQVRAYEAARRFVEAAYGYSGSDPVAYRAAVVAAVINPNFTQGAAATDSVDAYALAVFEGGVENAARLESWTPYSGSPRDGELTATAVFVVEGDHAAGRYEMEITVIEWGAAWRVLDADEPREI